MWQAEYKALKNKEYQEKLASRKKKEKKSEETAKEEEAEVKKEDEMPKGALIKVINVPEGYTREVIKEKWFDVLDKEKFAVRNK